MQVRMRNLGLWVGAALALAAPRGVGAPRPGGAASQAKPARGSTFASPGDLRLELRLLAEQGSITASEPLLAIVKLTNLAGEERRILFGNQAERRVHFGIQDSRGRDVGASRPDEDVSGFEMTRTLAGGASWSEAYLVTDWYAFGEIGEYRVRAEWLGRGTGGGVTVVATDEARLRVQPFDAGRLQIACQKLYRAGKDSPREWHGIGAAAVRGLFSVRHDVVLPYLDFYAQGYDGSLEACRAIRRVGTDRAKRLIQSLAARQDKVGEVARKALQTP